MNWWNAKIEMILDYLSRSSRLLGIVVVFLLVYFNISVLNHYNFQTSSDTYGIYTNAIYDYSHGRVNDCKLLTPGNSPHLKTAFFDNKFSDHFDPIQVVFSPLVYLFGSYTLVLVQIAFVIIGGIGVHRYFKSKTDDALMPNLATIYFFSIWTVYCSLACDYHDNVLSAMLLPWLVLFLERKNWVKFGFVLILMLACKETVALWLVFVFIGLAILHFRRRELLYFCGVGFLLSVGYFLLATKVIMPGLANEGRAGYLHYHFTHLGETPGEVVKFLLKNPFEAIKIMFTNHTGYEHGDGIKVELFLVMFISGGLALLYRPAYLIMVLPVLGQKVFHDNYQKWGLLKHYGIEFAPVFCLAVFSVILMLNWKYKRQLALYVTVFTIVITNVKMGKMTSKWSDRGMHDVFSAGHYTRDFNVSEVHKAIEVHIPEDENVVVSAHYNFVPHVALRKTVYEFPTVIDSDYIILFNDPRKSYPVGPDDVQNEIKKLKQSRAWRLLYDKNKTMIFQRDRSVIYDYEDFPWWIPRKEELGLI